MLHRPDPPWFLARYSSWPVRAVRRRSGRAGLALLLTAALTASAIIGPGPAAATGAPEAPSASTTSRAVAFQVGEQAPDFTLMTPDGQSLTNTDLLAQEKPFILYFFATW